MLFIIMSLTKEVLCTKKLFHDHVTLDMNSCEESNDSNNDYISLEGGELEESDCMEIGFTNLKQNIQSAGPNDKTFFSSKTELENQAEHRADNTEKFTKTELISNYYNNLPRTKKRKRTETSSSGQDLNSVSIIGQSPACKKQKKTQKSQVRHN